MRTRTVLGAVIGAVTLALALPAGPAQAQHTTRDVKTTCFNPNSVGAAAARSIHGDHADTRGVTLKQQRAIDARTARILEAKGLSAKPSAALAGASVPVYFHVMLDDRGRGDVTQTQINNQVAVLNKTYAGQESSQASNTGFTFTLAGVDRFRNSQWHAGPAEHDLPGADTTGWCERAEHLAGRVGAPRHRDVPVGLRRQPEHRRHPRALRLAPGWLDRQLQPG